MDEMQEFKETDMSQTDGSAEVPEPLANNKKNGKKWIIAAGVTVAAGLAVFACLFFFGSNQKRFVAALVKSMNSKPETKDDLFGFEKIKKEIQDGSFMYGGSLFLEKSSVSGLDQFDGFGIRMEMGMNKRPVRQGTGKLTVVYGDMDLAGAGCYLDSQAITLVLPGLSDRLLVLDYQDGFEEKLAVSYLIRQMREGGYEEAEIQKFTDILIRLREMMEGDIPEEKTDGGSLAERFRAAVRLAKRLEDEMEVERADSKNFVVNGKEVSCTGYTAVISHETLMNICQDIRKFILEDEETRLAVSACLDQEEPGGSENLESRLDKVIARLDESVDEVRMNGYVDRSGNMISLTVESGMSAEGGRVNFSWEFLWKGGSYLAENMEITMRMDKDKDRDLEICLSKEGGKKDGIFDRDYRLTAKSLGEKLLTGEFSMEFNPETKEAVFRTMVRAEDSMTSVDLEAEGVFDQIDQGKGFHFDLDSLKLRTAGAVLDFSGEMYCGPADVLEISEGEPFDLLTENSSEWETLFMEIYGNINSLSEKLGN